MKKYISDIIKKDYENWKENDLIFINAGTGTGKTYFIEHELNTYCIENNKTILYLTNRNNLKQQITKDIGKNNTITILNYQKIETILLKNLHLSNYDYIIMDEGHYFFTDAGFNQKTDLFFKWMLNNKNICKIIMTATPLILLNYMNKNNIEINYTYELKTDYGYLNKIIAFNNYESINSIIEDVPEDEQIILFSNVKKAYEISKKYNGSFICSEHNKDNYYKYVDTEELNNIIENSYFNNHLLCCTTALDNGINIKFGNVKHIIIDIFDRDEFIQCLGRKRIQDNEKINLYFYSWKDKKRINGFKKRITDSIDRANFLLEKGQEAYIKEKFKNDKFYDTRIIDEIIVDGKIQKIVNECIYTKYQIDLLMYNSILSKKYGIEFKNIIALNLGINKEDIIEMELKTIQYSLAEALEKAVGKKLFKDEQKEIINFIGLKANGKLLKSYETFNAYFKEMKLPYIILSKRIRIEGKLKTAWIIEKLIE